MAAAAQASETATIEIQIRQEDGSVKYRTLPEGKVCMVGSAAHHGLSLPVEGVADTHCMLSVRDGCLHVRDWNSPSGTFLNGRQIEEEAILGPGDFIRVGTCDIRVAPSRSSAFSEKHPEEEAPREPRASAALAPAVDAPLLDVDSKLEFLLNDLLPTCPTSAGSPATAVFSQETAVSHSTSWRSDLAEADAGLDNWFRELDANPLSEKDSWNAEDPWNRSGSPAAESTDSTVDELQMLRRELSRSEARVQELESLLESTNAFSNGDENDHPQQLVDKLSARLDQVLDELEASDERVSALSEMLTRAESANLAAQEERAQVENWIGEIEKLFSLKEAEWQAEREVLLRRIEQITATDTSEKTKFEGNPDAQGSTADAEVPPLGQELIHIRRQLAEALEERDRLAEQARQLDVGQIRAKVKAQLEAEMREEQLRLTEERAELARLRAEASLQTETPRNDSSPVDRRVADYKIRAFREHLKDLHATEPKAPRPQDSMSYRLGKIWRKLNGTPLDTD